MADFTTNQGYEKPTGASESIHESMNDNSDISDIGRHVPVTYGETIAQYDILYLKDSDGKCYEAKADDLTTARGLVMASEAGVADDTSYAYGTNAIVTNGSWTWNLDENVNLSDSTAGAIEQNGATAPYCLVGYPVAANKLLLVFSIKLPVVSGTTNIVAANGITVDAELMRVQGSGGAVNITADPQIADGYDGQFVVLEGMSDTNTVTYDDGTGLQLAGGTSFTQGQGDIIAFSYNSGRDLWIEHYRSDN